MLPSAHKHRQLQIYLLQLDLTQELVIEKSWPTLRWSRMYPSQLLSCIFFQYDYYAGKTSTSLLDKGRTHHNLCYRHSWQLYSPCHRIKPSAAIIPETPRKRARRLPYTSGTLGMSDWRNCCVLIVYHEQVISMWTMSRGQRFLDVIQTSRPENSLEQVD